MSERTAPNLLIVEAVFYQDIADALAEGAIAALEAAGATYERLSVPGALEIPGTIALAEPTGRYDGYIALGCVIRGETSHYDVVCDQSAAGLMSLTVNDMLAIGNGILTVENREQAMARAQIDQKNKGGAVAEAALRMIELGHRFAADYPSALSVDGADPDLARMDGV